MKPRVKNMNGLLPAPVFPLRPTLLSVAGLLLCLLPSQAGSETAPVHIIDDNGQALTLASPARRIISLAPHITELLFAAGAGRYIVGSISHSDYPPEARDITPIGDYTGLDMEAITALKPDLVVAWPSGNPQSQLHTLRKLGLKLFNVEPRHLDDIARTIEQLGELAGTGPQAASSAAAFRSSLQELRREFQGQPPVRVFFQVWEQPLLTINGQHLISDVIRLCGGVNVFAALPELTPRIAIEAVIAANPQVIFTGSEETVAGEATPASLRHWRQWKELDASRNDHLYAIDPARISRQTPRILEGARQLCADLQRVRADMAMKLE